jgi:ribose/xylose/arabinose/galactoside ABC-type transport system permease subunit
MTEIPTGTDSAVRQGRQLVPSGIDWRRPEVGLLIVNLVLFVILAFIAPHFLSELNLLNVLRQASFVGIVACGMTLVIISAEIDVSVGSAVALASATLGVLATNLGVPVFLAAALVIAGAGLIGAGAGWVSVRFAIPSFIVTLALFTSYRGLALWLTNAFPVPIRDEGFLRLGGFIGAIPISALVMLGAFVVFGLIAKRTVFGRSVYAVGGNAESARLSGISVSGVKISVFAITGALAGVVGVLLSARLGSGNAGIAVGFEFAVIAAVIIGGTSLYGGRGTLAGTFLGVMFVALLQNGMVLLDINPFVQQIVRGAAVLIAVLISQARGTWK